MVHEFRRLLSWACPPQPRADETPEYGPSKGTLIIIGGGLMKQTGILETFQRLGHTRRMSTRALPKWLPNIRQQAISKLAR